MWKRAREIADRLILICGILIYGTLSRFLPTSKGVKLYVSPEIRKKYNGKALIVPAYQASVDYYSVEDLEEFNNLCSYLADVWEHEADITKLGIEFLEEACGLKELAEILYQESWFSGDFVSVDEIYRWLQGCKRAAEILLVDNIY